MRASRVRWTVFGSCVTLVVAALAWVSERMLVHEEGERVAQAKGHHREIERLALWRLDTRLSSLLAAEASRDARTYLTRGMRPVAVHATDPVPDDSVRAPVVARFEVASGDPSAAVEPDEARARLGNATFAELVRRVDLAERSLGVAAAGNPGQVEGPEEMPRNYANNVAAANGTRSRGDVQQRAQASQTFRQGGANGYQTVEVDSGLLGNAPMGPFVALWSGPRDAPSLVYVRRGHTWRMVPLPTSAAAPPDASDVVQGFVVDWPQLRDALAAEIADLFPGAVLRPVSETAVGDDPSGLVLATAPIALVAPLEIEPVPVLTPTRIGLGVAWLAVVASLGTAALLLRTTVADADRRARFASSVTHELRTPLTTFRLYSEMLADGMVRDDATRQEYLRTLKSESARLATLVENVLAYARVEEGRAPRQRERIAVRDLVERAAPPLRRRADECGMAFVVRTDASAADAAVVANADAIGQVLANLVDNACKYAGAAADRTVELTVSHAAGGALRFRVRDHGPGLAPENVAAAFAPFERGNRPPGDAVPGIGLGLALSRGLARDHGGDLVHEAPDDGPGAAFVLTLPAA